jgi:hypothetical protein
LYKKKGRKTQEREVNMETVNKTHATLGDYTVTYKIMSMGPVAYIWGTVTLDSTGQGVSPGTIQASCGRFDVSTPTLPCGSFLIISFNCGTTYDLTLL